MTAEEGKPRRTDYTGRARALVDRSPAIVCDFEVLPWELPGGARTHRFGLRLICMLRRTASAGDVITVIPLTTEPRLLVYNDGTGCVIEFVASGEESHCSHDGGLSGEPEVIRRELPRCFARACQKVYELGRDLRTVLPNQLLYILGASAAFAAFVWVLHSAAVLASLRPAHMIVFGDAGAMAV